MINKLIASSIQLWLKTQVDTVERLEMKIDGRDRQILQGYIPSVYLVINNGVYRGIHLCEVQLKAENIKVNLGQILKGKSLRILEPILVSGDFLIQENDVNASLSSDLLCQGLTELILILLQASKINNPNKILKEKDISWQEIYLKNRQFVLKGTLLDRNKNLVSLTIRSNLYLENSQTLRFQQIEFITRPELLNFNLEYLSIDLGSEVAIDKLSLEENRIFCSGTFTINID
jgi:hypothetical protein